MREKLYILLNKIYAITMTAAFFGGLFPVVPFIAALMIGGTAGEAIAVFLYKRFYPWVFALAALSVLIGLAAMYVGRKKSLTVK